MKSQDKWQHLATFLQEEEVLLGERNTAGSLAQAYEDGRAELVEDDGDIIAFTALWYTPVMGWYEMGSVWVHTDHRGRKLGTRVFNGALQRIPQDVQPFLITHNPRVVHLALQAGWQEATSETWTLVPWSATCGPCDRWDTDEQKRVCPFRAVAHECRLFFTATP